LFRCGQSPGSSNQRTTISPSHISGTLNRLSAISRGRPNAECLGNKIAIAPRRPAATRLKLQQTGDQAVPPERVAGLVRATLLTERGRPRESSIKAAGALASGGRCPSIHVAGGGGWRRRPRRCQPACAGAGVTPRRPSRAGPSNWARRFGPQVAAEKACHHAPAWPIRQGLALSAAAATRAERPADRREGQLDRSNACRCTAGRQHQATGGKAAVELPGPRVIR